MWYGLVCESKQSKQGKGVVAVQVVNRKIVSSCREVVKSSVVVVYRPRLGV